MAQEKAKAAKATQTIQFSFGDAESVVKTSISDYLGTFQDPFGRYYIPPIDLLGLAQMCKANSQHGSCIIYRRNMLVNAYTENKDFNKGQFRAAVLDYLTFGNAYLKKVFNYAGQIMRLEHVPALNMRRTTDGFCLLMPNNQEIKFAPNEIIQIAEYDPIQQIYGMPDWLGGLQSALLNQDATLFRRRYYLNGSHLGYILYTTDPLLDQNMVDALTEKIKQGKGVGNFRSLYIHTPNGKEKGVQLIPVGDINQKDDFERIKNISADDVIVAHRVHPALVAIKPANAGGYGDIQKIKETYIDTEVRAMAQPWEGINSELPEKLKFKFVFNIGEKE